MSEVISRAAQQLAKNVSEALKGPPAREARQLRREDAAKVGCLHRPPGYRGGGYPIVRKALARQPGAFAVPGVAPGVQGLVF